MKFKNLAVLLVLALAVYIFFFGSRAHVFYALLFALQGIIIFIMFWKNRWQDESLFYLLMAIGFIHIIAYWFIGL